MEKFVSKLSIGNKFQREGGRGKKECTKIKIKERSDV